MFAAHPSPSCAIPTVAAWAWLLTACANTPEPPAPSPDAAPAVEVPAPSLEAALQGSLEGARATHVMSARVRAMPPGAPTTGAFFILHNPSEHDAVVVGASSPSAGAVELHNHVEEDGQFKMRQVDRIEVPAGQQIQLAPGGLHVMLIGLSGPLEVGDTVSLTLDFESGHKGTFDIPVQEIAATGQHTHSEHDGPAEHGEHAHH